jgi:hypothetical protein
VVQEPEVEPGVVGHEDRVAQERDQGGEDGFHRGGLANRVVVDPSEVGDEPGDGDPRIDQGLEGANPFPAPVLDRPHLGDP